MTKTIVEINCYTEEDMMYHVSQLKRYGYTKTADCMWTKIFEKDDNMVILNREF